jgi:hypothetical protein
MYDAAPHLLQFHDHSRTRRVVELLAVLWVLSLADLFFTLWAHSFTAFYELNPIARVLLEGDMIAALVAFKLALTITGTVIFWRLRAHRQAEAAVWALVMVYVMLTFRWSSYTAGAMTFAAMQ